MTSLTFSYQIARGLRRRYSGSLPLRRCHVHCTSLAVNGFPSCQVTPGRKFSVSLVPVVSQSQLSASSGTMVPNSPRGFIGSNRTRLLKIAMNGMLVAIVDSSWIDALGGCVV